MKNKGYITAIMLVSVLIATFIVRIFFIQNMMNKINVDEALLELHVLFLHGFWEFYSGRRVFECSASAACGFDAFLCGKKFFKQNFRLCYECGICVASGCR